MIVYDGIKKDFLLSIETDSLAKEVEKNILNKLGKHTAENEFKSWENSLLHMYKVLSTSEIPEDAGIAIEYNIPQTSKRVDFIISGYNQYDGANAVVVELKQWSELTAVEGPDAIVETFTGGAVRKVVHPSYQAWSYAQLIKDYNSDVQDERVELYPCVYMHNYERSHHDPVDYEQYSEYTSEAPVYSKGDALKLRDFIKKCIRRGDNKKILYIIDNGKIRPSKSLQNSIKAMLTEAQNERKEFILIDDQKVAYEEILRLSERCSVDNKKRTVIVRGGPGTGKSVIAINLLAELTNSNNPQFVQYVSKNSAPRNVYSRRLKGSMKKSSIDNMFKGTGIYTEAESNTVNTILVDEAHRLNEKSGMFKNLGENQVKEIINAAKCSVFFIDESQRVTMDDIGSVEEIKKWAKYWGSEISELELTSQFRCDGSDGYLSWIDNVFEIRETANFDLQGIDYDIQVFDSPSEVYSNIVNKNSDKTPSRMLAGYCWNWIKSGQNNTDVHDIVIGNFSMSWNLGNEIFAVSDTSINEIGCIHTSQGLEFSYVGVIIGDDMRYENGHVVTDFTKRASTDQSIKGLKSLYKKDSEAALKKADEIIKNTYRTLMTRGMKGCYIYCTDKRLSDYIKKELS